MTRNPQRTAHCAFCGQSRADAELLFQGGIGGMPTEICDRCVEGFHQMLMAYRQRPELADVDWGRVTVAEAKT